MSELRHRFPQPTKPTQYQPEEEKVRVIQTIPKGSMLVCLLLTVISLWTRLYKINLSNHVVWDEAHFGKFAGYYIKRHFYFDVHPPLGKMLNAFAGLLAGFNGQFEFESGAQYPAELRYGVMRFLNALFGAMIAPIAYWTGIHLRFTHGGAILLSLMTITDIAYCTISRFILLDSMLLFFTCLSVYCLVVFRNYQVVDVFSPDWFFWLFATGVSIGLVASVKWVGLFAIALVGIHTIQDLWEAYGNVRLPLRNQAIHWGSRILCLIIVPITVYVVTFGFHFLILNHSGPGDAQMSSLFQAGLEGNDFSSNPLELAYGSRVSFKNNARGGGLLHSHVQRYPSGSEQQQVTTYSHKDNNNEFWVEKPWGSPARNESDPPELVQDGDIIRLVHCQTGKSIHSHNVKAPITENDYEVSGYGTLESGDSNDHWIIQKVDDFTGHKGKTIRSMTSRFRFLHSNLKCLLRADGTHLPEWGFKQGEVVCQKKPDYSSSSNIWNIELHINPNLPVVGKNVYKSTFFRDFIELNVAMWGSNNALTPDPDKEPSQLESKPYHWPLMVRGLRMCGWSDVDIKYYLIGNPFIWWGSTAALIGLSLTCIITYIRRSRGHFDFSDSEWSDFVFAAKVGLLGWFLHYFPFYIMGRVMYVHHYFPALYFAMIAFVVLVDEFAKRIPKVAGQLMLFGIGLLFTITFIYFKDFVFGMQGSAANWSSRQWLPSWNIYG